jgi:hypothetical protein
MRYHGNRLAVIFLLSGLANGEVRIRTRALAVMNYPGLVPISTGGLEAIHRQYSPEIHQRELRLLDTTREASKVSEFEAIKSVASKLSGSRRGG